MHNPIFIFASGQRCGSTLLMRWLNSHPEVLLWGEHGGALNKFFEVANTMARWSVQFSNERGLFDVSKDAFTPNATPCVERIHASIGNFIFATWGSSARYWGFKEVRYGYRVAEQLRWLFPDARFIHLTRDPRETLLSLKRWKWPRDWIEKGMLSWQEVNESFLVSGEREWILRVKYESLLEDRNLLLDLIAGHCGLDRKMMDESVFARRKGGSSNRNCHIVLEAEDFLLLEAERMCAIRSRLGY